MSVETEYKELKKNLLTFYNECKTNAILRISAYENNYFGFDNKKLYMSITYLLNNFKYQTKIFYHYLIKENLKKFNIIVVRLDTINKFGFLQYNINNKYFNIDLFYEVLKEIFQTQDSDRFIGREYGALYAVYLLDHQKYFSLNNEMDVFAISEIIGDTLNLIIDYSLDNKSDRPISHDTEFIDFYSEDPVLKINNVSKMKMFINTSFLGHPEYENNDYTKTISIEKSLSDGNVYFSQIPYNGLSNSFDSQYRCIKIEIKYINIFNDILNKYSFSLLNNNAEKIKEQMKNKNQNYGYFDRIIRAIDRILSLVSSFYDNMEIFGSYITEAFDEIKDNISNTSLSQNKQMTILSDCSQLFLAHHKYDNLNTLFATAKKIILELPDFLDAFDIKYSPNLLQLII